MLTQEQANLICDAFEIFSVLSNEEEIKCLEDGNPELLEAYFALHRIAAGSDTAGYGGNHFGKNEDGE